MEDGKGLADAMEHKAVLDTSEKYFKYLCVRKVSV